VSFTVRHLHGAHEPNPPPGWEHRLFAELANSDGEHTDVSVLHESGWTLSAFAGGLVVWEDLGRLELGQLPVERRFRLAPEEVLAAWRDLAEGRLADVEARLHRAP
jgi:hypothetical protein